MITLELGSRYPELCKIRDSVIIFRTCFIRVTSIYRYAPSLVIVYKPNVGAKGDALTKTFVTHRTDVGFLAIVYSPNVKEEVNFP